MARVIIPTTIDPNFYQTSNLTSVCATPPPLKFVTIRFYMVGVFGLSVALLGIFMNIVLLSILLRSSIYLSALALLDIAVSVTYVLLMCQYIIYEYLQNYFLYNLWHICLPYFYTLSRIVTLASTYMLVVCTAERFLEVSQVTRRRADRRYQVDQRTRYAIVGLVILVSVATRLVVFWEIKLDINQSCSGTLVYYELNRTWLVHDFYYYKIYSFYIIHFVQVFFPFGVLVFLNALIIRNWRLAVKRTGAVTSDEMKKRVKNAQSARQMMLAIVTSYLICNLLNLVLTFMEHIDSGFLQIHDVFYAFSSDAVTMLTVVNASFRLPIYYATNLKIRTEIRRLCGQAVKPVRVASRRIKRKPTQNCAENELAKMMNNVSSDGCPTDYATFDEYKL